MQGEAEVWMTVVVIYFLTNNFPDKLGELSLVLRKADKWLLDRGVDKS